MIKNVFSFSKMGIKIVENLKTKNCKRVVGFIIIDSLLDFIRPSHESFKVVFFNCPTYLKNNRLYYEFEVNKFIVIEQKCSDIKRNSIKLPDFTTRLGRPITILLDWLC